MFLVTNHNTKKVLYQNESRGKCNQWILETYYLLRDNDQGIAYGVKEHMLPYPMRIVEVSSYGSTQND